ncbi:hypothetical protein GCM10027051_20150 [Niabella terrae]
MKSYLLLTSAVFMVALSACSKSDRSGPDNQGKANVQFVLTDAPAAYDAVMVNIREVQLNMGHENEAENWVSYPLNPELAEPVNLLDLKNGASMYMGDPYALPAGTISQIRLVLGDGNTVVIDGQTHDLSTPSAQQSGLKIKFNQTLEPDGIYTIWLDFDAARSVVKAGNSGRYNLKPVLYAKMESVDFGAIRGTVLPSEAGSLLYLLQGADTIGSSLPEAPGSDLGEGYYKFINLNAGTYSLSFDAVDSVGYKDTVVSNIVVAPGKITDLSELMLSK